MGKATCVLLGLVLAAVPVTAQTEHIYSPGDDLERSELAQLDTATRTIDVAMYSFTDRYLAEEFALLARKGIRIRVYRDREQFAQEAQREAGTTTTGILLAAGVEVRIKGREGSHAPQELCHRWSAAAYRLRELVSHGLKRQDNDVLYESSPDAVEGFERKFEEMWVKARNTAVDRER